MPHLVSHITQVFSVHHKLGMMIYNRHALELAHNFFSHRRFTLFLNPSLTHPRAGRALPTHVHIPLLKEPCERLVQEAHDVE